MFWSGRIVLAFILVWGIPSVSAKLLPQVAYQCDTPLEHQSPPPQSLFQPLGETEEDMRFDRNPYCALWLRYHLETEHQRTQILTIRYPTLDWVRPWLNGVPLEPAGAALPLDSQPLKMRFPTWLLHLDSGSHILDMAVIDSTGKRRVPLRILDLHDFLPVQESKNFFDGLLIGWLLFHVLIALILLRIQGGESGTPYYVAYVATSTAYQIVASGHAFAVLWPSIPQINLFAQMFFALLPMPFAALWMLHFQNTESLYPKISSYIRLGSFFMIAVALSMPAILFKPTHHIIQGIRNSGALEFLTIALGIAIFSLTTWIYARKRLWESLIILTGLGFHMLASLLAFSHDLGIVTMEVASRTRILQGGLVLEFFIISGFLALRLHRNHQRVRELELLYSTAVVRVADQEREKLARELHDDIGQQLVALQLQLYNTPGIADIHQSIQDQVRSIMQRVRQMAHTLHPPPLLNGKLGDAIQNHALQLQTANVCDFVVALDKRTASLNGDAALHILRIVQETTNNALRHARARRIDVESFTHGDKHFVSITNDGEPLRQPIREGMGLTGIRARLRLLSGSLQILSPNPQTREGARFIVSFPSPSAYHHATHSPR